MDKWQASEWLSFVGIILAAVGIAAAIWAARTWGTRRCKLLVAYTTTGLLPLGATRSDVKLTFHDLPVTDPHLVTLRLKNIGSQDITRDHFDGGEPLKIALNSTLFGLVGSDGSDGAEPSIVVGAIGSQDAVVGFAPCLMPRGTEWVAEFIVSGSAAPKLRGRLVNTDIVEGESTSTQILRELTEVSFSALPWPLASLAAVSFKWGSK